MALPIIIAELKQLAYNTQAMPPTNPSTPPQPYHSQPQRDSEGWKSVVSTILLLVAAPLVAIFLTLFVFQSYQVDGPSMQTTLQNGNRLIVYKLPRTWSRLTKKPFVPERGKIIVFNESGLSSFGDSTDSKQLIKRVLGLPGDRVVVKNGTVTIYNAANPNGFNPDKTMPYGKVITTTSGDVDITVPAGQVFVFGDNRPDSLDSRYFGTVPVSQIIGELGLRVYPFSGQHVF